MKRLTINDISQIIKTGKTPPSKNKEYYNGDINWYSPGDIRNNKFLANSKTTITDLAFKDNKAVTFSKNTLLVTCIGDIGRVGITQDICSSNQQITGIVPNNKVDVNFLFYWFLYNKPFLELYTNKAVVQILNNASLKKIPFKYCPPIETQKKIAVILDEADKLRQLDKQLIEKYDALTQSLFLDMFGDPIENSKGWEVRKLKDLTTQIGSGNTPKGGSKVYVEEGIAFFRSQNVWRNRIEIDDIVYLDQATHDKMGKSSLKHKDILMTKTGRFNTKNSSLGRAAMYLGEDDKANLNGHVYLIRPKKNVINEFILFILTTIQYRDYIRSVCVGGIDKRQLNKGHLEDFPIIYPPIESQKTFVNLFKEIEFQKSIGVQNLNKSEELFNSLLQKAFKGKLVK